MTRTPAEVGAIIRQRREVLGLTQEGIPGVSSSLVRAIERGTAPTGGRNLTRQALMAALQWPSDTYGLLLQGYDPDDLDPEPEPAPIQMAASGIDLEELRRLDPEAYEHIRGLAEFAIDRARQRAGQ